MGDSTTFIFSNHVIDLNDFFLMNFCIIANLFLKNAKNDCRKFFDFFGKKIPNFCTIFEILTSNAIAQMATFQIEQKNYPWNFFLN
jgi:hypothetical protein